MSHLGGPSGKGAGMEVDTRLATRANKNLSSYSKVRIVEGDGTTAPFDQADVIYVNAGVTRPADQWLDGLREGGRLILPLTTIKGFMADDDTKGHLRGALFLTERRVVADVVTCVRA